MSNSVFFKAPISNSRTLTIKSGKIEEVIHVANKIPEFNNPYPIEEYHKRLKVKHLILIAFIDEEPVGFKIGYEIDTDCFYSWLGGILPKFRKLKIASELINVQEKWAKENHYNRIEIKTRNYFKGMLLLSIKHDYHIICVESRKDIQQNRITLSKEIQ